ncbi:MAG: hypothetical protein IT370_36070 [Deltaproteobacteria bacterium]|nr:hypothetical protein [Deltaproteobacteria bacterium]
MWKRPGRRGAPFTLLACALLVSGCGPTSEQAGRAILAVLPVILLISAGMQLALLASWRVARPDIQVDKWPLRIGFLLAVFGFVLAFMSVSPFVSRSTGLFTEVETGGAGWDEWIGAAFMMTAGTFVALHLLVLRIMFASSPGRAFSWSFAPPLALFLVIALANAFRVDSKGDVIALLIYPGLYGVAPLIIFVVLMIEAGRAGKRAKAAPPPPPPPAPPPYSNLS